MGNLIVRQQLTASPCIQFLELLLLFVYHFFFHLKSLLNIYIGYFNFCNFISQGRLCMSSISGKSNRLVVNTINLIPKSSLCVSLVFIKVYYQHHLQYLFRTEIPGSHHKCTKSESLRSPDICVFRSSSRSCEEIIMEVKQMSNCPIKSICHLSFTLCPYCCLLFYICVFLSISLLLTFPAFFNLQLLVLLTFHSSYQKFFFYFMEKIEVSEMNFICIPILIHSQSG